MLCIIMYIYIWKHNPSLLPCLCKYRWLRLNSWSPLCDLFKQKEIIISSESNVMLSLQLIRSALYHNLIQSVITLSPMLVSMYDRSVFYWSQCYSSIIMIMYARSYYHKHTFYEHLFFLLSVRIESFSYVFQSFYYKTNNFKSHLNLST